MPETLNPIKPLDNQSQLFFSGNPTLQAQYIWRAVNKINELAVAVNSIAAHVQAIQEHLDAEDNNNAP